MYKKAVKRELIGQYAETFWLNGKEKKFYGAFNKKEVDAHPWDVILVSTKFDVSNPYYEHIEPISYTYNNLCSLKSPCIQKVKDCMRYSCAFKDMFYMKRIGVPISVKSFGKGLFDFSPNVIRIDYAGTKEEWLSLPGTGQKDFSGRFFAPTGTFAKKYLSKRKLVAYTKIICYNSRQLIVRLLKCASEKNKNQNTEEKNAYFNV